MKSILQQDESKCYLCGCYEGNDHLDIHHVFEGSRRKLSEKYGLKVKLHHRRCHLYGDHAVHYDVCASLDLKRKAQEAAMQRYGWTVDDWIKIFHKSYL